MPKTKKKFIDKKKALTFNVVYRSQQDPLIADENAPQHVLVPVDKEKEQIDCAKRKEEQKKYGIYFDDDYDYLQHLRNVKEMRPNLEPALRSTMHEDFPPLKGQQNDPLVKIQLPSSVFASTVEENVGLLNKAAPHSGLCLELDPDVVAAMDDDFDFKNLENQLEDNFLELANADRGSEDDGSFETVSERSENYSDELDDDVPSLIGSECTYQDEETKSRFTNYSMSSSIIRRNNQLSLLDDRFEQLFTEYDDNEIGALDNEEIEGHIDPDSELIMQCVEDLKKLKTTEKLEIDKTITLDLIERQHSSSESETDLLVIPNKTEKWDCESVLSTYSNQYNHPKLITEPKASQRIHISQRTGVPLEVLDGRGNKLTPKSLAKFNATNNVLSSQGRAESIISTLSSLSIRPKSETLEEKRERKKAIKEYRKERRMERKLNTEAFKEEKKKQEKMFINNRHNLQGMKIL